MNDSLPTLSGPFAAELFDGRSARRHAVGVTLGERGLVVEREDGSAEEFGFDTLQLAAPGHADSWLVRRDLQGWRLSFRDGLPDGLADVLPRSGVYGAWIDRLGLARAALVFALVSGMLAAIVLTAPRWLAPVVPYSFERRIGDALVGDFAESTCHTPAGDAALARLLQRVDVPGKPPIRAQVVKFPMVNAIALPGGRIVIFSGLLTELKDPDAVAGVVAHELGHQRERHVMQAMLRQFGISLLLAGASGNVPSQIGQLTGLHYSREAEEAADAFAKQRLANAAISPLPTAAFFRKAAAQEPEGNWLALLSTHPASADRARAFAAQADRNRSYRSALTAAEWRSLFRICSEDKRARPLIGM